MSSSKRTAYCSSVSSLRHSRFDFFSCGACCAEQGAPPDYVALRLSPHLANDPSFADDFARYRSLSGEPLELLEQYFVQRADGSRSENGVCVWFDPSNCNCRFYDLRPSTCRVCSGT